MLQSRQGFGKAGHLAKGKRFGLAATQNTKKNMKEIDNAQCSTELNTSVPTNLHLDKSLRIAAEAGCASAGTLEDLASEKGIPLACTSAPLVTIIPAPPSRHKGYYLNSARSDMTSPPEPGTVGFEGGEHTAIGDAALLFFFAGDPGTIAAQIPLPLPNGLKLTYGQIVALAGDFYGVPEAPISDGASPADIMARFKAAYNTLAVDPGAFTEAPEILQVMQTEITAVSNAIAQGESASSAYEQLGDTLSEQWNRITGGGSVFSPWIPLGRYLKLAAVNWDHFGQHAVTVYTYGHTVAMQMAVQAAGAPPGMERFILNEAYAMNAFADHFLSDAFSAGHVRAPRKELYQTVTPSQVGSYLSRYMHDEDSHWGLNLDNEGSGQTWHSYGDKRYFDTVDFINKAFVDHAVQLSVNEVFNSYITGVVTPIEDMQAVQWIPTPIGDARTTAEEQAIGNISPLFSWDGSQVSRRNTINNLNDYSWTNSWWGWSTLALLTKSYAPDPPQNYPQPPTTAPTVDPNGWQSAQSVPPNWVSGAQVRYAVSFYTGTNVLLNYESDPGPWCPYVAIGPNQAFPTLTGLPIGPDGTTSRYIYRQFAGGLYARVGSIRDNATTTFVDQQP